MFAGNQRILIWNTIISVVWILQRLAFSPIVHVFFHIVVSTEMFLSEQ